MTRPSQFISPTQMEQSLAQLNQWLTGQSIKVPGGWVDACVEWLIDEHGGLDSCGHLTRDDWCRLVYEQWLHSDLRELSCPVLPSHLSPSGSRKAVRGGQQCSTGGAKCMKVEGELCLQVVGLFNIGQSYHSQLRQHEGNISVNLPYLDNLEADLGNDPDHTQMTQALKQTQSSNADPRQSSIGSKSLALFLTDGVAQIKVVEIGNLGSRSAQRILSYNDLAQCLRPGVKVRIRGPLTLRGNVLVMPPGALQTLSHPQFQVLGGEVDELLESHDGSVMYQVGLLLAKKLNIAIGNDGALPSWFPSIDTSNSTSNPPDVIETPSTMCILSVDDSQKSTTGSYYSHAVTTNYPSMEPWGDDGLEDAVLNEAAQNMEASITRPTPHATTAVPSPKAVTVVLNANYTSGTLRLDEADRSLEDEVDPDVFAEAMSELDNATRDTHGLKDQCTSANLLKNPIGKGEQPTTSHTTFRHISTVSQMIEAKVQPAQKIQSPCLSGADDLLPPPPKRKPWERKSSAAVHKESQRLLSNSVAKPGSEQSVISASAQNLKFRPFCYIEDMRMELFRADSNSSVPPRRVYTIRGLLITLLSPLEHHQGARWTLAARLADGSAIVDVNISSELLTEWIGLTAAESESLCQMSRALSSGTTNAVALQEAQKHRARLRTALFNCQARLSNLAGLFDLTPPPLTRTSLCKPDADSAGQDRPVLVGFRELNMTWLRELHDRVSARGFLTNPFH